MTTEEHTRLEKHLYTIEAKTDKQHAELLHELIALKMSLGESMARYDQMHINHDRRIHDLETKGWKATAGFVAAMLSIIGSLSLILITQL